jgi:hypothetical protein
MRNFNLLLLFVLITNFVFGQNGVNVSYTNYPPATIAPIVNQSNITPLKLTDRSKTINGLSYYEQTSGTFYMPSYYNNNTEARDDKFVYVDRNGNGPSLTVYYLPYVKIFKRYSVRKAGWFNQDDHYLRENWLQFGNEVNGSMATGVGNSNIIPALGQTFEVKLKYKLISTMRSRNSDNWSEAHFNNLSAPPNVGSDQCDTREEKAWETADEFRIVTKEAKWINIDESLLSLKFCNEGQTINLYDYFSDKTGVTFALDGTDLPNEYLKIGDIGKGDFTLTARKQYENGTFSEDIALKIVNMPSRVVDIPNPTFCEGTTSTLTAPEAPEGETYTYLWSNGETTRSITVSNTFSGTVKISNGSCEVITETVGATMMPAPKPRITNQTNNNNICDGESAVLVTNEVAKSYTWLNQDDEEVGKQQVFYATVAGTYKVIAYYENGCSNVSDPITITVSPNPAPTILVTGETEFCEGESVILTAQLPDGQIASSYTWSNGQVGQSITVTEAGVYTVTARNLNGCSRISEPTIIKVNPNPKPLVSANGALEFCDGGSVKLTVTNAQGSTGILWSTGETTPSIDVSTSGLYYVTVQRADCENTSEQVEVKVYPNITPTIQALGETILCEGEKVTLQVTNPQPDTEYTWSNGARGLEIEVTSSGRYYVIAKNQHCSENSESINVTVNPIQTPVVMSNGVTEFCEGGSVTLTVTNASDQDSILWSNGETTRNITVTTSGRYYATITKNNCQRTSEYTDIKVYPNPKPTIEALGHTDICQGESLTIQVTNPQPNTTYTWSNGATGLQTEVSTSGNYYVISTTEGDCMRNSDPIQVSVNPIQKPAISLSSSPTFCEGGSVTLTVTNPSGSDAIRWSNGEVGNSITVTESGNYYAVLEKGDCERMSDEITIEVIPNVKPIIEAMGGQTICEGETLTLQVTNPQPNVTYTWSNGVTGTQTKVSASGNYFVTSQNGNSCSRTSDKMAITVLPIAKPTIYVDNETTICQGDSIVLTINETGASYRWSNGATTKSITVKNSGTYTAYISNGQCERASEPIKVTVKPNNKIAISQMGELTFCEGENLTLTVINGGEYLWNTGETTRSITITKSGKYSVMVTNEFGCVSNSETYDVTVRPIPKPSISITGQTTICEGDNVILTIDESATSYRWSNGATTKSITVKSGGTYTAYISNEFGCERASDPVTITVNPNPVPTLNVDGQTEFCETDSVVLYVTPIAGMKYTWSNGEEGNSITVRKAGNYYVTSTTPNGCAAISRTVNVTVHPLPKPTIHLSGTTTFCEGDSVVLTINETGKAYRWSNGETTKSITVKTGATFTAYIINEFGCERASDPVVVTVNPNPIPQININGQTEFCETDSVILYVSPIAGMKYTWSNGEEGSSITVKNTGNYYVTSTTPSGCTAISNTVNVTVHPLPKPTIHVAGNITFCEGDSVILTINEIGKAYRWSNGETTKSITVKTGATYIAFIKNEFGCERASDPVLVTVNPNPKPTISYSKLVACEGDSVKLTASNGVSYLWSNGETTKDIYVKYPSKYSVMVTNSYGCSNISDSVAVDILPNDVPTISSSNGSNICQGESTTLTASKGAFYLWNTGETTQSITVTKAGKYWVTVTNENSCSRTSLQHDLVVHQPLALKRIPDQQICINGGKLNLDDINTNELGGVYEGEGVTYNLFDPAQVGVGTFKIKYTFTTEHGCVSSIDFGVEVVPIEILEVGPDIEVCLNGSDILLQVETLPVGVTFEGTGVSGNLFKPQDAGVGIHEILYSYTNKFGCVSTARRIITVNPIPTDPKVSGNSAICNNNALTLIAQSSIVDNSPITYNWYREGDDKPFETGQQIRYVVTKNEKIYVQAVSRKGCPSERTEVIITSYTPEVRLTASATTITQGSPVQFTLQDLAGSNPSVKWEYDFGDGFRSQERNPLHYYNRAGVYTVKVKAYAEQGCFAEIIEQDFIIVEENPVIVTPPTTGEEPIEDNNPFYKTVVYPNPLRVGETATLRIYNQNTVASRAILQVYSISGSPLLEQHLDLKSGQNEISVENTDRLTANTYYLFVIKFEDGRTETIKVLVL